MKEAAMPKLKENVTEVQLQNELSHMQTCCAMLCIKHKRGEPCVDGCDIANRIKILKEEIERKQQQL